MKKEKYVYRTGNCGWLVTLIPKQKGKPLERVFFGDKAYGGKGRAHHKAIQCRDKHLKSIGMLHCLSIKSSPYRHREGQNYIVGVRPFYKEGVLIRWIAYGTYKENGKPKSYGRCFTLSVHGKREAFKKACKARYEKFGDLIVVGKLKGYPSKIPVPHTRLP